MAHCTTKLSEAKELSLSHTQPNNNNDCNNDQKKEKTADDSSEINMYHISETKDQRNMETIAYRALFSETAGIQMIGKRELYLPAAVVTT